MSNKNITVEELDDLSKNLIDMRATKDKMNDELKAYEKEFKKAQAHLVHTLIEAGKTSNQGSWGRVSVVTREYYRIEDKQAAMNWLKERGEFEALASVNAQTYSAHVKSLVAAKQEEGDFAWVPPGTVDSTSDYQTIRITKG